MYAASIVNLSKNIEMATYFDAALNIGNNNMLRDAKDFYLLRKLILRT